MLGGRPNPAVDLSYPEGCEAWAENGRETAHARVWHFIARSLLSGFYLNVSFSLGTRAKVQGSDQEILFGVFFSFGLVFITLTDSFLFTHDIACVTLSCLVKQTRVLVGMRAIAIIFLFNYIGCVIGAFFFGYVCQFYTDDDEIRASILAVGVKKTSLGVTAVLSRGMFCNWMVCLANFLQSRTESIAGKAVCVILPISAFASIGLEHGVVNMSILTMCLILDSKVFTIASYFKNIGLALIGNCVGGILFMTLPVYYTIYWARREKLQGMNNS